VNLTSISRHDENMITKQNGLLRASEEDQSVGMLTVGKADKKSVNSERVSDHVAASTSTSLPPEVFVAWTSG